MDQDQALKVLVVDDTLFYRKLISDILAEIPGVHVVGNAGNGQTALGRILSLQPDLLTLDVEMPGMTGLEVLQAIKAKSLEVGVIMVSTLTSYGSQTTIAALELGAFDFVTKPQGGSLEENRRFLRQSLGALLQSFVCRQSLKRLRRKVSLPLPSGEIKAAILPPPTAQSSAAYRGVRPRSRVVGIGISTGGPQALIEVLPRLPSDLGVPVLIVQHMPPVFTRFLAQSLNAKCPYPVREAEDGMAVASNVALIAPGGRQMQVTAGSDGAKIIKIRDDPPENSCKPSVDYLFRSLAREYGAAATGVIMTGMGYDGTAGLKLMKGQGAVVIAQDEATCVVYGMPKGPTEAGIVDVVAPLDKLAAAISRTVKG